MSGHEIVQTYWKRSTPARISTPSGGNRHDGWMEGTAFPPKQVSAKAKQLALAGWTISYCWISPMSNATATPPGTRRPTPLPPRATTDARGRAAAVPFDAPDGQVVLLNSFVVPPESRRRAPRPLDPDQPLLSPAGRLRLAPPAPGGVAGRAVPLRQRGHVGVGCRLPAPVPDRGVPGARQRPRQWGHYASSPAPTRWSWPRSPARSTDRRQPSASAMACARLCMPPTARESTWGSVRAGADVVARCRGCRERGRRRSRPLAAS